MKDTIRYDAPEFYPQNQLIMRVEGPYGLYFIISEGDRSATYMGHPMSDPREFRNWFPDGELPEDSDNFTWHNNAWFGVYDIMADGVEVGEPMMSLAEAVTYALDLAYGEL